MREIKFRGKRLDNGEWLYGDLIRMKGLTFIIPDPAPDHFDKYMVNPTTVGQLTGMIDDNGVEMWEHDIIHHTGGNYELIYYNGMLWLDDWDGEHLCESSGLVVVGNIHDNPELLKKQ